MWQHPGLFTRKRTFKNHFDFFLYYKTLVTPPLKGITSVFLYYLILSRDQISFFLLLTITYPPARIDATASADIVPIGELSAVDTAFLDLLPLPPLEDVADAAPVTVASGSAPVWPSAPPLLEPGVPVPDGVIVVAPELN